MFKLTMVIPMVFSVLLAFILTFGTSYTADSFSCQGNQITLGYENETIQVELFNVQLSEKGRLLACDAINNASQVTFELDSHVDLKEPYQVYLFVDGKLLQKLLIEQKEATTSIANPDYLYAKQFKEAEESAAVFKNSDTSERTIEESLRGRNLVIGLGVVSIAYAGVVFYLNRRISC